MAKRGIDNVLGNLIGPPESALPTESEARPHSAQEAAQVPSKETALSVEAGKSKAKTKPVVARRGRPPGTRAEGMGEKKKVTWSIDPALYEAFVKRSYREECQVWELLERAIKDYLEKAEKE